MPVIVYKMDASPPARTVLITAEILGLNIETRELNVLKKEQFTEEYLKKNPVHTIPVIEDGDFVLSDSHAIIIYLVTKYGAEKAALLYPSDVQDRAIVHQRLFLDASILFPRLIAVAKGVVYEGDTSIAKKDEANIEEAYSFLEKYLERSPFLAGENITIADIACVTTVTTLNILVPISEEYPMLKAWLEVLSGEEWHQKRNQPGIDEFKSLFTALLQKNAE